MFDSSVWPIIIILTILAIVLIGVETFSIIGNICALIALLILIFKID